MHAPQLPVTHGKLSPVPQALTTHVMSERHCASQICISLVHSRSMHVVHSLPNTLGKSLTHSPGGGGGGGGCCSIAKLAMTGHALSQCSDKQLA